MKTTIDANTFTQSLFALLEETFTKTHGIYLDSDTSLTQTLANFSAEQASRPIVPNGSTVAAHVFHARFYLDVMDKYIQRIPLDNLDWPGSWKYRTVNAAEWESLKNDLQNSYQRVLERIKSFDDWNDENRLGGAMAVVAHTAFHLGAIRQMLTVLK